MTSEVNINITKEEAKELYNSGNNKFKEIALKAYPESMLNENSPESIIGEMLLSPSTYGLTPEHIEDLTYLKDHLKKLDENPMIFLRILGLYINEGWTRKLGKTKSNSGWFITKRVQKSGSSQCPMYEQIWDVLSHSGVYYPGITYFETLQGARKAMEILGEIRLSKLYEPGIL